MSLFVMYMMMFDVMKRMINIDIRVAIFLFILMYFNKDVRIIKYIIIEPVSGSKNVSIEGIKVIMDRVSNDLFFIR